VEADDDDVVSEGAPRQPRSRAARNEREIRVGEGSHDGYGLVAGSGKNGQLRLPPVPRQPVRIVNEQLTGPAQDVSLTNDVGQLLANRSQLHARNVAIRSLAATRYDEANAIALDPVVEGRVHSFELAVEGDRGIRAPEIDAAAVDDEAVELRKR
jgi:hypothetical protein